jgi:AraC-like DNA-binding protein
VVACLFIPETEHVLSRLDVEPAGKIAASIGITDRHLRRLFREQVGDRPDPLNREIREFAGTSPAQLLRELRHRGEVRSVQDLWPASV